MNKCRVNFIRGVRNGTPFTIGDDYLLQEEITWYLFFDLLDKGYEPTEQQLSDLTNTIIGYVRFKEWIK